MTPVFLALARQLARVTTGAAVLATVLAACASPRPAGEGDNGAAGRPDADPGTEFEAALIQAAGHHGVPGMSYAIAYRGEPMVEGAWGWANEAKSQRATLHTPFAVASLSKTFSSTVAMRLAEEGLLDLDRKVTDYVPALDYGEASVRDVLSHRSLGVPGSFYLYSARFGTLDQVYAAASGVSYAELLAGLAHELGLAETFGISGEAFETSVDYRATLAEGYAAQPDGGYEVAGHFSFRLNGGNGLVTSVHDMLIVNRAHEARALLTPAQYEEIEQPLHLADNSLSPYGYGWFHQATGPFRLMWHVGAWPTATAFYVRDMASGYALILLTNSDGPNTPYYLIGTGDAATSPFVQAFLRYVDRAEGRVYVNEGEDVAGASARGAEPIQISAALGDVALLRWQGRDAAADAALKRLVAEHPAYLRSLPIQAVAFHLGSSDDPAVLSFMRGRVEAGLERTPANYEARFYLAEHYVRRGDERAAGKHFAVLLDYADDLPPFMLARTREYLGRDGV